MTMKHGVYVTKEGKAKTAPEVVDSGIPFYIGASPVQGASSPAKVGVPVLCESFEDAREKLGYSDDWTSYPLCEAMDVHFRLYGMAPAIFCNLLDPVSMQESAEAADIPVEDGQAKLPAEAILDDTLVVKEQGGSGEPYVKGTDYTACYPADTAPENAFIPVSRMFDWVGNTLVKTFWNHLDKPILRRRLDSIIDGATIWLNGLTGSGYLYGGRVEIPEADNPKENLVAGIVKPRIALTPPSPAQEITTTLTYDASYADSLFE